jgi:hypothetical protein
VLISFADGMKSPATFQGKALLRHLDSTVYIENVLYVPGCGRVASAKEGQEGEQGSAAGGSLHAGGPAASVHGALPHPSCTQEVALPKRRSSRLVRNTATPHGAAGPSSSRRSRRGNPRSNRSQTAQLFQCGWESKVGTEPNSQKLPSKLLALTKRFGSEQADACVARMVPLLPFVRVDLAAGDVLVMHPYLVHFGGKGVGDELATRVHFYARAEGGDCIKDDTFPVVHLNDDSVSYRLAAAYGADVPKAVRVEELQAASEAESEMESESEAEGGE